MICGGIIVHDEVKQIYACSNCKTEHASELFASTSSKRGKIHIKYPKLKIFFALLGALYLLFLTYRIFNY
jgi:hypothetical protein